VAGVGHEKLSEFHVWSHVDPARQRGGPDCEAAKTLGYLMALSGLAYIAQGWVLGSEGFSAKARSQSWPATSSSLPGSRGFSWLPGG
jgi:hypothetical protein